ncbi:glycosyltransferase [Leucobacter ruminantium]|uniref:Glycosyltransferase n=1 Tax=Leucobacter ruminantium TaxID=1289170 RepID=A0A939S039_9MICO|nr:glycosyltransferase [Leucobacter ruminantium]
MNEYAVDVVIAVHSAERPVARAAGSVLTGTQAPVRVTVVAHNIDPEIIRERLGDLAGDPRLRLIGLADGIHSPAGPMNLGFARAEAPFVALLGSDDELAPGAIDSWLALQRETGADAVLARILLASGEVDPYPPVRLGRRVRDLDGAKDRLAYRSAPLGMVSRERFGDLRLTTGVGSGEDLVYSLTVWFTGAHLAYDLTGPAYVVNGDAGDRVTSAVRPLAEDSAFLDHLETMPWFAQAPARVREAIVVKLIRMHVFDALAMRANSDEQLSENRDAFRTVLARLARLSPSAPGLLSIADRRVLDALVSQQSLDAAAMRSLIAARSRYKSPAVLLTRNPLRWFHAQAPFRTLLAGSLIARRR